AVEDAGDVGHDAGAAVERQPHLEVAVLRRFQRVEKLLEAKIVGTEVPVSVAISAALAALALAGTWRIVRLAHWALLAGGGPAKLLPKRARCCVGLSGLCSSEREIRMSR